ncbi:MAG: NTP transferase domain-containing protein [Nanoarchaeota archaeon]|nr:NTP transferase domain-containing protein [Nanoarchaeota archaeon]
MKAIILAAGKGKRTQPLTLNKPKPLLKIANKTLIEHNLDQLIDLVDEVIVVIGYRGDMIKKRLENKYENMKISYVEQKEQLGTGHALMQVEKLVRGERFIVMMGDDLYFRGDMRRCLRYPLAVMAKRMENYADFGVFINKEDKILDLIEKPGKFISDLVNAAFYVFDDKVFKYLKKVKKSQRKEYELTDAFRDMALTEDIFSVEAKVWLPIAYPWNLLEADQIVRDEDVRTGKDTIVKGKVMDCSIGDNCVIEGFVKNSIIGDNVIIHKDSVVEDSIIGDNVNFIGTIKTSERAGVKINDKTVFVENFGAVIGDGCILENVLVHPGTIMWPNLKITGKELKGVIKK